MKNIQKILDKAMNEDAVVKVLWLDIVTHTVKNRKEVKDIDNYSYYCDYCVTYGQIFDYDNEVVLVMTEEGLDCMDFTAIPIGCIKDIDFYDYREMKGGKK